MNVEEERVRTFGGSWTAAEAARVAAAGFYYVGPGLTTKCFSCGLLVPHWAPTDIISLRHAQLSPQCPLLTNPARAQNVPLIQTGVGGGTGMGCWSSDNALYKSEQARLESFADWPIPFIVQPQALAAAGFYFLHQGDKVECAFCTGIINRWERSDVPMDEHRRHFPTCPFLLGLPVGNIPATAPTAAAAPDSADLWHQPDRLAQLGIQPHRGPRHVSYSTVDSRIKTFEKWPHSSSQTPSDLAQAGFFHETDLTHGAVRDQVRCFHCDGGLRNWEPGDTAWREHARWFPTCQFLLLVKGQHYVDTIQLECRQEVQAPLHTSPSPPSASASDLPHVNIAVTQSETEPPQEAEAAAAGGLEEENRRLRDARQCKICMDAEIGTVLLPCGHLVACVGCAPSLLDCPLCRQTIKATVRTFLS